MSSLTRNILCAIIAASVFFLLYFVLIKRPVLSAVLALAVYIALFFILQSKSKREEKADSTLKSCEEKLYTVKSYYVRLSNKQFAKKVEEVINYSAQIINNFKSEQSLNTALMSSLNYYLDILIKIVSNYIKIASQKIQTEELQTFINKMILSVDKIKRVFEKQLNESVEEDLLALDSELSVLNDTLELEDIE